MTNLKLFLLNHIFKLFGKLSVRGRLRCGVGLTKVSRVFLKRREKIVRINLDICFPNASVSQKERWVQQHFRALNQSIIDRGMVWYGAPEEILQQVHLKNTEVLDALIAAKKPIVLLAPHFVALDVAATRLTMHLKESATIYTPQHDKAVDTLVLKGRSRFNQVHLISRKDGVRGMLRHLKRGGIPVYYLPDMDFGRKGSIFVPFFGTLAATLPTTAHLAKSWHASVVPILTNWDPETGRYTVHILNPLENFPGTQRIGDATLRINKLLEQWILQNPSQYYWVHRRFKTRPSESDPKYY